MNDSLEEREARLAMGVGAFLLSLKDNYTAAEVRTAFAPYVTGLAQATAAIKAPGLVFMAAYGDNREVRGMFDTAEQAHAFVKRLDAAMRKDEVCTAGGGLPGDHNGARAAAAGCTYPNCAGEPKDDGHGCCARPTGEPAQAMRQALEALATAQNGLQWYRDAAPEGVSNGCDDEADEEIAAAIAALDAALTRGVKGPEHG